MAFPRSRNSWLMIDRVRRVASSVCADSASSHVLSFLSRAAWSDDSALIRRSTAAVSSFAASNACRTFWSCSTAAECRFSSLSSSRRNSAALIVTWSSSSCWDSAETSVQANHPTSRASDANRIVRVRGRKKFFIVWTPEKETRRSSGPAHCEYASTANDRDRTHQRRPARTWHSASVSEGSTNQQLIGDRARGALKALRVFLWIDTEINSCPGPALARPGNQQDLWCATGSASAGFIAENVMSHWQSQWHTHAQHTRRQHSRT